MFSDYKHYIKYVEEHGDDILKSDGMIESKNYIQHGDTSVYHHCVLVAAICLAMAKKLKIEVDEKTLVRGALLHDYFLYDWHEKDDDHKWHGFIHEKRALKNAQRDFKLNHIEENMIESHMFPLNFNLPRFRESILLCVADKVSAVMEFFKSRKKAKYFT
jgi:uncharacterized protein